MAVRTFLAVAFAVSLFAPMKSLTPTMACCPAPPLNKPVVNADQTVIILWDAATQTEHFIRQASFKGEAQDFGFLVPSPSQPTLEESGNEAFPYLLKVTEPEKQKIPRPSGGGCSFGCGAAPAPTALSKAEVRVLQEKMVAGFDTAVLEADTSAALVTWLKDHGYAYSPEIEAWAKPYVGSGWKITAFKVAKPKGEKENSVATSALRMSFKTERPLFPYREPDYKGAADALGAVSRMLRIYLLAEARYEGAFPKEGHWSGKVAWADKLSAESREKTLAMLKLPEAAGPKELWLTEFEDNWPYKVAPGDVYFARDRDQGIVKRPPHLEYAAATTPADVTPMVFAAMIVAVPIIRRARRRPGEV